MKTSDSPSVSKLSDIDSATQALDDAMLVEAIAARRDRNAFNELFSRYETPAYNLACNLLQNSALAEEAVQEAMLAIWVSPRLNLNDRSVRDWVLGTVAGKSLNIRRSQKKLSRREKVVTAQRNTVSMPSDESSHDEVLSLLRRHLKQLPEMESQILACCFGANLTHQKTGELLGMPQRTITNKIQQALQQLRTSLQKAGVAAVVPALSTESIARALTSGHPSPSTLQPQLTANDVVKSRRTRRSRPQARNTGVAVAIAAAVVVAAVIGATAIGKSTAPVGVKLPKSAQQPAPVAVLPVTNVATPKPQAVVVAAEPAVVAVKADPAREKIFKQWDYGTQPAADSDLKSLNRNTVWRKDADGIGKLYSKDSQGIVLLPRINIDRQFMRIKLKIHTGGQHCDALATWVNQTNIVSYDFNEADTHYPETHWTFETTFVFSSSECLQFFDGQLSVYKRYGREWPGDQLIIQTRNLGIEKITIESLTQDEMDSVFKAAQPAVSDLRKSPVKKYGQQTIPAELLK